MIELIEHDLDTLAAICRAHHVRRLEIFGSAVDGTFDPETSDLDFLVEFERDHDLGPWLRDYFDFRAALEELFGRCVDLVMPRAMKNPYFIREVDRTRRLLYAA